MKWFQLSITTNRDDIAIIENTLTEAGALSLSISNADNKTLVLQSSNEDIVWKQVRLTGLFDENIDIESLKDFIHSSLNKNQISDLHIEQIENRDWTTAWMEDFKPIQVGERMWVIPEWITPPDPSAINILITPVQA